MKKGWEVKKIGDVCDIFNGGTPDTKVPKYWGGDILWITPKDMGKLDSIYVGDTERKITEAGLKNSSAKILPTNSVVLSSRAPIGHLAINTKEITTNQGCRGLVPKKGLSTLFLYYFLKNSVDLLNQLGTGTTFKELSSSKLAEVEIPVPPLPEQQRIVSLLDETFAGLAQVHANAERNLVNAREVFENYLKGVFENKHDDWEEKKLGDIGKVSMCKRVYKEQTTPIGDIPFYKIGTFGKEPDVFIPKSLYNEFRNKFSFPKKGDVLISAAGTIGRRVKYDGEPAYFQDSNIVWIDNDETQVLNDYLYQFYGACNWNSTTGATIPRLYNDNLRQIKIAFPKSLAEQRTIVERLDALAGETSRLEEVYQSKREGVEELRKSVLREAFEEEL